MKVLLNAYVNGNLGDDLMIKALCSRYPKVRFTLVGKECYAATFADCLNIQYVKSDTWIHRIIGGVLRRIFRNSMFGYKEFVLLTRQYRQYVIIGGSMFIESNQEKIDKDAMWLKRQPYIVGFNFGPYSSTHFLEFYKENFASLPGMTTRDRATLREFQKTCKIEMAPDVVFTHKTQYSVSKGKEVIISIAATGSKVIGKEDYLRLVCDITRRVFEKGLIPVLVSFCKSEGDEDVIAEVLERTGIPCRRVDYCGTNADEIERHIASANCVIAGRFHSMILAFLYQKKCLPIVYSPKMTHVLDDIHFRGYTYELSKEKSFNFENLDVFLDSEDFFVIEPEYLKRAKKQFVFVDEALS